MTIKSVQKVIQVGSSIAVTIPARDARKSGIKVGDDVVSIITMIPDKTSNIVENEYEQFKKQYHKALKNLANR